MLSAQVLPKQLIVWLDAKLFTNIVQVLSINLCSQTIMYFITTFIVQYIIAAFFPFCAPGCEIVAPPPKRQRCDTASELENHYYTVIFLVITVFHTAFFKFESCFE